MSGLEMGAGQMANSRMSSARMISAGRGRGLGLVGRLKKLVLRNLVKSNLVKRDLVRDQRGVAVLEFAFIAPVFIMMMMGIFNIGQIIYVKCLLNGAVQQAARFSATESANTATADNIVKSIVGRVAAGGVFTTTRSSYFDFADVNRAEKFTDANNDGACAGNETYFDENSNGHFDLDVGVSGNGGANDVVVMTTSVAFTPVFRIPFMPNQWQQFTLSSTGVTKNQPFATQANYSATTGTCP